MFEKKNLQIVDNEDIIFLSILFLDGKPSSFVSLPSKRVKKVYLTSGSPSALVVMYSSQSRDDTPLAGVILPETYSLGPGDAERVAELPLDLALAS